MVVSSTTRSNQYNYDYYKDLFTRTTIDEPTGNSLSLNPFGTVVQYYHKGTGDYTLSTGAISPSANTAVVYLVEGNLNITGAGDLTIASGKSAAFIVSGKVTVAASVDTVEGIFIVGGDFDASSGNTQLSINGSLYADRFVGGRSIPPNTTPAYKFTYEPKYLLPLVQYLGKSQVNWQEVAP